MRNILEKAIVCLLNEDKDQAEALFHRYMVEKARKIHESLRSGEATLSENWDDEITSEEYVTEDDLEAIEDTSAMGAEEASDELADEMDVDADEIEMDADADMDDAENDEADMDDAEDAEGDADAEEGETEDRLSAVEDQMEKLVADFEALMADEESKDEDEVEGDLEGMDDAETDMDDGEGEMADDMEMADHEGEAHEEGHEDDDVMEGKKGKIPPQFLKNMKKKVKEEEEADEGEDDLDDITESVMAELELISMSMEDGKEVGAGKKIVTNTKSNLVQANVDKRGGAKPVVSKSVDHVGYERETAPAVKDAKPRKNTLKGKADAALSKVPEKGNKAAALNKDYAGSKNDKSSID